MPYRQTKQTRLTHSEGFVKFDDINVGQNQASLG